jgi:hypothetical protein
MYNFASPKNAARRTAPRGEHRSNAMTGPHSSNDEPIFVAWQLELAHAAKNPFLFQLLLKQYQRILKRLAYFYAQLASLPRRQRRALQRALATSLIGAAMLLALSSAPVVHAATINVGGTCTLDDAITAANTDTAIGSCTAGSGADTIVLSGNVTLGVDTPGALPTITSEITLVGSNFFVSGNNAYRVFDVAPSGDFTINDTTIQDGYYSGSGGGIFNAGTLELNNSVVRDNVAGGDAGGIFSFSGTVTLNNSAVSDNSAGRNGGGIYNYETLTLNNSTISGNSADFDGGGIYNFRGVVNVNDSLITGNEAGESGGIYNYQGNVTLINSTIEDNHALDEDGGGIRNRGGYVRLFGCTVSGNTADDDGGGLDNSLNGEMLIVNSTLSGNSAGGDGGGFRNSGSQTSANFFNVTIVNNSSDVGGGIAVISGEIWLERSIVSGNSSGTESNEIYNEGTVNADNFNLFGHSGETNTNAFEGFTPGAGDFNATSDGDGTSTHIPTALASILNTTLALNGNPNGTLTHALVTGSPALDRAPNADCSAIPVQDIDQRGFPRNVNINGGNPSYLCDIGAFELQATTAVNVTNVRGIARADKNVLKWQTTSESQIAGFNVWRRTRNAQWTMHNAQFLQAKHAGSVEGAQYRFADKKVKQGKTYRYKIEVKYLDGHTEWTNVIRVNVK